MEILQTGLGDGSLNTSASTESRKLEPTGRAKRIICSPLSDPLPLAPAGPALSIGNVHPYHLLCCCFVWAIRDKRVVYLRSEIHSFSQFQYFQGYSSTTLKFSVLTKTVVYLRSEIHMN